MDEMKRELAMGIKPGGGVDEEKRVQEVISSGNATLKDKKLRELMQKNKELNVMLESEKSKRVKLEGELTKMAKEFERAAASKPVSSALERSEGSAKHRSSSGMSKTSTSINKEKENADTSGDDDWKQKFVVADKKVQELRVQLSGIKNDFNKAMRVISREIGEGADVDKILLEENGWKGRAQQIELLKGKVKDLQARLSQYMGGGGGDEANTTMMSDFSVKSRQSSSSKAEDRRNEIESIKNQNEQLKNENDQLIGKMKALNSRKTVLENELRDIKMDYEKNKKILLEKSEADDRYIAALKTEIDKLKNTLPPIQTKIVYKNNGPDDYPPPKKRNDEDSEEVLKLKREMKFMIAELDRKEKMISELICDKLNGPPSGSAKLNSTGSMRAGDRDDSKEDSATLKRLQDEITKLRADNEELSKQAFSGVKNADQDAMRMIKDLSTQNAQLRRKVDDLQTKLNKGK
eukprot:TRINITY_DN4686_c0_g2_i1.p1 TRINITY_DN4686_c0_g2~~TRINITY_DN4686_c0_g2_i1.p1  ORF type:complete len:464 (+),score=117.02 TRINITY_DN4686_c0_g2_i1:404-1795(+)